MTIFRTAWVLSLAAALALSVFAQSGSLRIAAVDVEGGQATLFVAPGGQSLLVDTGWDGHNGRDADRIVAAAKAMGLSRIDTVLITHFHEDHVGGVPQLVERIPVGTFLDHGGWLASDPDGPAFYAAYQNILATGKYRRLLVKAGEKLPAPGFDAVAVSAAGRVLPQALSGNGGKANPICANVPQPATDTSENGQSLGILMHFAGRTILDVGDLTSDREHMLVCPANKLGKVDLLIVSHHGVDLSSSPVFIHSIAPRVAVMDNGAHKGGSTSVMDTIRTSPRIEALYQLHPAPPAGSKNPGGTPQQGAEHNVPAEFLANDAGTDGKRIDIAIRANGTMDVTKERTGDVKHYTRR